MQSVKKDPRKMNKPQMVKYLQLAGITKLNPTESMMDALRFVNWESRCRVGSEPPYKGGPLPGFYTTRENFVRIKTRKEWNTY